MEEYVRGDTIWVVRNQKDEEADIMGKQKL